MRYAADGYAVLGYFLQNETQVESLAIAVSTGTGQVYFILNDLQSNSFLVSTSVGDIYSTLELQSDSYINSTGFGDICSIMSLAGDAEVITDMKRGVLSPTVMYPLNGINRSYPLYGINRSYP